VSVGHFRRCRAILLAASWDRYDVHFRLVPGANLRRQTESEADRERLMKPKKPTTPASSRGRPSAAVRGGGPGDRRAVVLDFVQSRIEAFNAERGGGVSVRKDPRGYTLLRFDDGSPIARLRPKGSGDRFEILYWSVVSERWRPVGPFGGMVLALPDALEFIANDPMDCFWR